LTEDITFVKQYVTSIIPVANLKHLKLIDT